MILSEGEALHLSLIVYNFNYNSSFIVEIWIDMMLKLASYTECIYGFSENLFHSLVARGHRGLFLINPLQDMLEFFELLLHFAAVFYCRVTLALN